MDFQLWIDHGHRIAHPHLAGADRVIDRIDPGAQHGADIVIAAHVRGEHVLLLQGFHRRRFHQPPRGLVAGDHRFHVLRLAEKVRIDGRRQRCVGAAQADMAAALRPEQADMTGKP
jgi:hypothetical protein